MTKAIVAALAVLGLVTVMVLVIFAEDARNRKVINEARQRAEFAQIYGPHRPARERECKRNHWGVKFCKNWRGNWVPQFRK